MANKNDDLTVQKAMAYDLKKLFEDKRKDNFTMEEVKEVIDGYIKDAGL